MRLADFILANTEPILTEWESFARGIWPGRVTDPATLRDDAEGILRGTASDMKSAQSAIQQSEKSKGRGGHDRAIGGMSRASEGHGADRMALGFDLAAVIAEYRALRASVIRLWRESGPTRDRDDLDDLTRFNESIDQSLTEAVTAYTRLVDRDRQAALDKEAQRSQDLRRLNEALLVSSVRQHELTELADRAAEALREAKEQSESANRAKDTFLAVLSHELRTPLAPVVMAISAIEIDPELPFRFREDLSMVRRNIDLEVKLIDDLLDLSRVINGKLRLHFQSTSVHELLVHVLRSSASDASAKRLRIRQELHARNDRLEADPARLQQVLWNLMGNAVKFTPEGGEVTVRTWNAEGHGRLYVEVRDTGVGIEPDVLPRIFDAFEQGEVRMARHFGGLGLGLAIAKAVVEMHGGIITASSGGRDTGTTFTVELKPDTAGSAEGAHVKAPHAAPARSSARLRVLLVEDHPDTARVTAALLKKSGYDVTTASNAASALRFAEAQPFDIVISDIGLPDGTGYDLMATIRDRHGIKGIALSGYGMEDDMRKSREAGFIEHVVKPVAFAELEAVIRRVTASGANGE